MDRRTYLKNSSFALGGIIFSGSLVAFMQSCQSENKAHKLRFFSEKEARLVVEVAEIIIPRTDTPGAKDAGVGYRIDEAMYFNYEPEDQRMFKEGLQRIDVASQEQWKKDFVNLSAEEKNQTLLHLAKESRQIKDPLQKHIYPFIKGLTVLAYFTSEIVNREVLKYDPIPGVFHGCIPFDEVGGVWGLE
ncbi:MAG TPA: gluconate 2-dehydrogenase subunit 3 family protein [Saprospiraceae bacterium]|nr:gluconate 2-dehydrogenase subunit 3 family protein [Saprospiraceae bacterium]